VRRGVSGLIAVLVLGLVMVSLISTAVTLSSRLQRGVEESSSRASRILSEASQPPVLSLYSSNGALYVEIVASRPLEIRGFIVELPNSVSFKPAGNVTMGVSRFKVVEGYNCEPARVHVLLASGLIVSYDPRLDPRIGFTPKGWDGWWRCSLAQDAGGGWWIVDPLRMQPVKALGGGGNDTVEYDIYVTTSFTGSTVIVDRVYRQEVPALEGYVTVSLRGELVPVNVKESLLVLRMTGPSNSTFFTGDVSVYIRVKGGMSIPGGATCNVATLQIFPVVYTANGVVTRIQAYARGSIYGYSWCGFEYEMRYRVSLVDSNVVSMAYVNRVNANVGELVVEDARYEVNVTLVKAKVVDVKPAVYSLGSPGWVRLQLLNYTVVHDPLTIRIEQSSIGFTSKTYSIPPWVGFIWPGTARVYNYGSNVDYGGNPQVTVVLDAGGGLSKNFTLTPGRPITLAYPGGEVKIVVTPRPEPPFNDPYAHERTDPTPIFAPWRAPAIIAAEYADGRKEIIVVSPTGHVTIGQGNLVFTGYGQLLGGLPFTFTPSNSRLAETPVDMNSFTVGKSSWLPQPAISATNTYRIVAVIPGDRLKAGYVITWIN